MKKKHITAAQRRHQDYLRRKGLAVGKLYMTRLAKLRNAEVKRVLELCKQFDDKSQWGRVIENNLNESSYFYDWTVGLYLNAGLPNAQSVQRDLSKGKAAGTDAVWESTLRDFAQQRAGKNIVSVSGTLLDDLQDILDDELEKDFNIGVEKLAKNITKRFNADFNLWQARRIAQTETMIGLSESAAAAAKSCDIAFTKEWCISGVGNTRDSHAVLDGVVIEEDEYFEVGDSRMLYPHDESMAPDAGEIINCACSCIRRPK